MEIAKKGVKYDPSWCPPAWVKRFDEDGRRELTRAKAVTEGLEYTVLSLVYA